MNAARTDREVREEISRAVLWNERTGDHDDSLQMLVLCCHPCLSTSSAVALTLRAVAGLGTREIAAGLLVPEATVAQRISRAKATLRARGARFGAVEAAGLAATPACGPARAAPDLHHRLRPTRRRRRHGP